jgi:excisionase family DNA binding protein
MVQIRLRCRVDAVDDAPFALADPLLTVEDVARVLRMNDQTIRNYIDAGTLPAVRVGGRRMRIRQSALEDFIAAGESVAAPHQSRPLVDLANAVAESTAALSGQDRAELARAFNALADAARELPDALGRDYGR